ncbi:trehalase-like domain-containing protein, partial [Kitasatospora sp. NPDC089797]|uniref:glycoside hydrolase family 15 protein n=1 Tax=Kitasatospora sp. NPDC089797 TaxID=3155298 RepID=UPI00343B464D
MTPIEKHALIGNCATAALVDRGGTVDWLCLPRFDSPAVFAALLGTHEHGSWQLAPATGTAAEPLPADRRRYRGDSLILEQEWDTRSGTVRVLDFMPTAGRRVGAAPVPRVVRIVEGVAGTVRMRSTLRPRFGYGRTPPTLSRPHLPGTTAGDALALAVAGPHALWLAGREHHADDGALTAEFTVRAGERVAFTLTYRDSHRGAPALVEADRELARTADFWRDWADQCTYQGPYREAVIRSLITLKGLTYAPTGGIVAAPTTSLPEDIGGERNWDYRYTWLRDAAITLSSLLRT